jgi:glycosyltransferase involved in cell wall biosynthesis
MLLPSVRTSTGKTPKRDEQPSEDWRYKIYRQTDYLKNSKYPFRAFCGGNVCFPRSLIDDIGGFDEDFNAWGAEDTEFGFRVYNAGYWLIPVKNADALHQEPPNGSNETDREVGKSITQPILIEKCPAIYRKYEKNRVYEIPKLSIYIPAYNSINFIEEAIESALNQTYTDLEIVVVNDGSTDGTGEFLDQLYGTNPRIKIIHQENGGISSASNTAIMNSSGEYILQLDSDDVLLPMCAELLIEVLEKNDIGFVYGDSYLIDSSSMPQGRAYSWSMFDRYKLIDNMMIHHPRMFRKRDYCRTDGFDTNLSNAVDYDFFLKLSEVTDGYHLQTPLYLYRQHQSNTSKVNLLEQNDNNHLCIISAFERMGLSDRVTLRVDENDTRKIIKTLIEDPNDYRINLVHIFSRLGIIKQDNFLFYWELDKLSSKHSKNRQDSMRVGKERYVRVGSYGSARVAYAVSSKIESEYLTETSIYSLRTKNSTSYFVDIVAPKKDNESLEMMRKLMQEHNWKAEVVSQPARRVVSAVNKNTESELNEYIKIHQESETEPKEVEENSKYSVEEHWKIDENILTFYWGNEEVYFFMPNDWEFRETHEDLFRLAHYVLVSPWDNSVLDGWLPTRKPGWRPGLAFSGGIDSTAALALMPSSTVLVYNERHGISGQLKHTNAHRFFKELEIKDFKKVFTVKSNHESIRMRDGKLPGFSSDYACAVQLILMADYFGLDSIGTGMPLENTYLWHGFRFRDFSKSWFWKHYSKIFSEVGLDLYQPVAGCSEIINLRIVKKIGWENFAQSCLRSDSPGEGCSVCWKCFRKNSLMGKNYSITGEIKTFLGKKPLKQAVSTIYSIQKSSSKQKKKIDKMFPSVKDFLSLDLDFLNFHYAPALEFLPLRYREFTKNRLKFFAEPMNEHHILKFNSIDLYPELDY